MKDDRHSGLSVMRHPPAKSRLARLVRTLSDMEGDPAQTLRDTLERVGTNTRNGAIALLRANGVSADPVPADIAAIVNVYASAVSLATAQMMTQRLKRRIGRPSAPPIIEMIVVLEVARETRENPGRSHSAVLTAVSDALGPGIAADHVRRCWKTAARRLGTLRNRDPRLFEATMKAFAQFAADLAESEGTRHVRKTTPARPLFPYNRKADT